MNHLACRLLLCVLLGVLINHAIAALCAWRTATDWHASGPVEDDAWVVEWLDRQTWVLDPNGPHRPVWYTDERGIGLRRIHLTATVLSGRIRMPAEYTIEMVGWPARSQYGIAQPSWNRNTETYDYDLDGYLSLPGSTFALPIRPLYLGLLMNVALYAVLSWLLLFGIALLVRSRRRRRGCCPTCGYDLRGHSAAANNTCPECGHAASYPRASDAGNSSG